MKQKKIVDKCNEEGRLKDYCIILFGELNIVRNSYKNYKEVTLDNTNLYGQVFEAIRRRDLYQARE